MLVNSRGIVLNALKYNDDTVIAQVLTERGGYRSFAVRVKHGRRTKAEHVFFYPLSLVELTWEERTTSGLVKPKMVAPAAPLTTIAVDPRKTTIAMFLGEFMYHALRSEPCSQEIFSYVYNSVLWLDLQNRNFANFHIVFLLKLTRFLGFFPKVPNYTPGAFFDLQIVNFCALQPSHNNYLQPSDAQLIPRLLKMKYENMHLFHFSGAERNRFLTIINDFYRIHVSGFPELKSLAVLRDLYQ